MVFLWLQTFPPGGVEDVHWDPSAGWGGLPNMVCFKNFFYYWCPMIHMWQRHRSLLWEKTHVSWWKQSSTYPRSKILFLSGPSASPSARRTGGILGPLFAPAARICLQPLLRPWETPCRSLLDASCPGPEDRPAVIRARSVCSRPHMQADSGPFPSHTWDT